MSESISFKPDSDLGYIKADLGQMEQIVMNLVVNARDAMPQGGAIAIASSRITLEDGYTDSHVSVKPGRYVVFLWGISKDELLLDRGKNMDN